jgi:hypothetical protein
MPQAPICSTKLLHYTRIIVAGSAYPMLRLTTPLILLKVDSCPRDYLISATSARGIRPSVLNKGVSPASAKPDDDPGLKSVSM